ncbi:MAG: M20/M25/M40 family metallo-hydrolase [Acidobacteria bacterium]|nr:M20/M25/M40 family metallo-hydrolase [Acidobacteriota bacterium]MCA1650943.1 M20/M25/M40 family metallo-hydrolase [Acidobacteriota bacterium]
MRLLVTLLITIISSAGCATHSPTVPSPQSGRGVISEASVRGHMEFLAGDALNGRGSGTRDEWIAATYFGAQMRRWGIEPLGDAGGYVKAVEIERQEVAAPPVLTFPGGRLIHGQEMLVQSVSGAKLAGPLQKLRSGAPVTPGALVLLPETPGPAAPGTPSTTAGATAVLRVETTQDRSRWAAAAARMPTMAARLVGVQPAAPGRAISIALDKASYAALSALADGTMITVDAELKPGQRSYTWNAMGRIAGSDPAAARDVILLTAHLDHLGNRAPAGGAAAGTPAATDTIYNGADDDASGSVAVLELAEALARGPRPKRTIIFTWFGSEEAGGYGARYFIDRPPVPLERIVANLEFEMIGRPDPKVLPHTLWLTGYERSNLGPELARQGAKIVQDPHPDQNFFSRSDNIQLARRGVIAQTVSSFGLHAEYHQPSDEVRLVDFAHMTDSIRSMLEPVRWLVNSSFKPAWLPGKKP